MKLFTPVAFSLGAAEPLAVAGMERLDVLPYVRSRLVFAALAARLLRSGNYDQVIVDLPHFMNDPGWLDHPLKIFPMVSTAIFRRSDGALRAIVFTPGDAACAAVYCAMAESMPIECLDDSDLLNYPEGSIFDPWICRGDDYRVLQFGLQRYFDPLWKQMETAWCNATQEERFFTQYRAGKVADRLMKAKGMGKRTLIVCEYRLWWSIRQALSARSQDHVQYLFKWRDSPGVLRVEDPYFAWIQGVLDDYPAVTLEFWNHLNSNEKQDFDKLSSLDGLLAQVISYEGKGAETMQGRPSIRRLIVFQQYLQRLVVSNQRIVPEPGSHLFHAARACCGHFFYRHLAEKLLQYPTSLSSDQMNVILSSSGTIVIGGQGVEIEDFDELPSFFTGRRFSCADGRADHSFCNLEREARQRAIDSVHRALTLKEREALEREGGGSSVRWAVKADYELHSRGCLRVRALAQREVKRSIPRRSWGNLEQGIHWKATFAAIARGENALFVKHGIRRMVQGQSMDEHTPVVFLLAAEEEIERSECFLIHDSNLAQRNMDMGNMDFPYERHPGPDRVFSVFGTCLTTQQLLGRHVKQQDLTSLCFLYTGHCMGLDRYHAIVRRPKRCQCRLDPCADSELSDFPDSQRGIAWAVKYAFESVVVVARQGWRPSARLKQFAHLKKINLVVLPLSSFRPEFLDRLARLFFISTNFKKHPQHERIARRFIY